MCFSLSTLFNFLDVRLELPYCLVSQYFYRYSYQSFNLFCHICLHPTLNVVVAVPLTRILVSKCLRSSTLQEMQQINPLCYIPVVW
jgi:hypothetical protein